MDEHVSWEMVGKWVEGYSRPEPCSSARAGSIIIGVENGMLGLKHPREGLLQILDPNDFKIGVLRKGAKIIVCDAGKGDYYVYVLNPGSEKIVLLELVLEKEAFGIYSQDYVLGFRLSREFCASALGKNLLVVDEKEGKYALFSEKGVRGGARLELASRVAECTVIGMGEAAICTRRVLFVIRGDQRVGIDISKEFRREVRKPEFGVGKSEKHRWLAVKDGEDALIVSLTNREMGYAVLHGNEFRGKEIMQDGGIARKRKKCKTGKKSQKKENKK